MCAKKSVKLPWFFCAISLLCGFVLSYAHSQNVESQSREQFGNRDDGRKIGELRDELQADDADQSYIWDGSLEINRMLEEEGGSLSSREAAELLETETETETGTVAVARIARAGGNRDKVLVPPELVSNSSPWFGLNVTASTLIDRRKEENSKLGDEESKNSGMDRERDREREREREKGTRGKRGGETKKSKDSPARRYRAERRRRRKNRERKRGRQRTSTDGREKQKISQRSKMSKLKRRVNEVGSPASERTLMLDKIGWISSSNVTWGGDETQTSKFNLQDRLITDVTTSRASYRPYEDTVEREFSKQLEKEISKTQMVDPASLENRILGSSVSRSTYTTGSNRRPKGGSDSPILDLENEILARTANDYNAYMASSLKLPMLQRRREEDTDRRRAVNSRARFHGKSMIDENSRTEKKQREMAAVDSTTTFYQDDAKGDLSCINGTFLPAPLVRHALIKYVKSSTPGHEYLEADYECAPGFSMDSSTNRLLCRNREWIGQLPRCKPKETFQGACIDASCEHMCKEVDGRPVCSCYKGFRLEDDKCMDINECLLNNGHGPCQDTCRNTIGGYECSCEGLQDAVLSPDNHTCQNSGPCSVNNAGCSHTCLSTMGRVFCLCPDGFILRDDWKTCQDVDECVQADLQTEICRYGCINTPGSYRCADPTESKDQPTLDRLSITCLPGYEATAGTCIDIDECKIDNGGCTEVCENTDGSFFCACDGDEKALSSDGKSCVDINNVSCPPLNPEGRGYLMCSRLATSKPWRGRRKVANRPGTKCFLKCPYGYQLHGEYELTCRSDGSWDGPKHGECVRYSKPRLECPKDVIAELPPGRDEAFVTFDQPSTDLDWFRYVRSKPSWGTRLEANLSPGEHEIVFFARHPVSKKQASCVLRIIVKGGEAPKVKDCPNDIEVTGRNGTAILWTEPIFTDNVKVTRIRSNESPGRRFDAGGHRVEYEASDDAGWSSKCVFTVVLRQE